MLSPGFDGQSMLLTLATHTPLNSLDFAIFVLSIFVAFATKMCYAIVNRKGGVR